MEIEEGVEGLVHVSEMDWTNKNVNPNKVVALGDEVEVMVLDIDEDRRRISLGMKRCQQNPGKSSTKAMPKAIAFPARSNRLPISVFSSAWTVASTVSCIYRTFPGICPVRKRYVSIRRPEVEAVVLAVDPERERISLGIKQLDKDPFSNFVADHPKGSVIMGRVVSVDSKGHGDLGNGVEGTLRASNCRASG